MEQGTKKEKRNGNDKHEEQYANKTFEDKSSSGLHHTI